MCARMCRQYGLDSRKGYLAGIGHDMCKDFSDKELIELAARDGFEIIDFERKKPALLHGRAAAVMLREKFKILDLFVFLNVCDGPTAFGAVKEIFRQNRNKHARQHQYDGR